MNDDERPRIESNHERAFCALHMEPYRSAWPKGYPIAVVLLARAVLADAKTIEAVDQMAPIAATNDEDPDGRFERAVEAVLDAKPACCRVSRTVLRSIYIESKVTTLARCQICKRKGPGTPYRTADRDYRHVCIDCVLDRMAWLS